MKNFTYELFKVEITEELINCYKCNIIKIKDNVILDRGVYFVSELEAMHYIDMQYYGRTGYHAKF